MGYFVYLLAASLRSQQMLVFRAVGLSSEHIIRFLLALGASLEMQDMLNGGEA